MLGPQVGAVASDMRPHQLTLRGHKKLTVSECTETVECARYSTVMGVSALTINPNKGMAPEVGLL